MGAAAALSRVARSRPVRPRRTLRLRFPLSRIRRLSAAFPEADDPGFLALTARARRRGWLTRADLIRIARWKTPRSAPRVARNSERAVRDATRRALSAKDETARVEALLRLSGIGLPTASVILHFCHRDPYPILDVNALWSLSVDTRRLGMAFWLDYADACRRLARRARCSMRTVDRALWQFAKENAPER